METNLKPGDRVWIYAYKGREKATVTLVPDAETMDAAVMVIPDEQPRKIPADKEWAYDFADITPLTQDELHQEQAEAYLQRDNVRTAYTDPNTGEVFLNGLAHETARHLGIKDGVVPEWLNQMVVKVAAAWIAEERDYLADRLKQALIELTARIDIVKKTNYGSQHDILLDLRSDKTILDALYLNRVTAEADQE